MLISPNRLFSAVHTKHGSRDKRGERFYFSLVMGAAFPTTCSECVLSVFIAGVMDESLSLAVECLLRCLGDVFHPTVLVSVSCISRRLQRSVL